MAGAAPAEGREALGVAAFQDRLKVGWQGLKASIEKTAAGSGTDDAEAGEARPAKEAVDQQVNALFAWAEKARKAVSDKVAYDAVPTDQPDDGQETPDVEKGEAKPAWALWAKAASAVKKQVATAAEEANKNLKQGIEKAKSVEFAESASKVGGGVSSKMKELTRSASNVGEAISEKSKAASQKALDLKDKTSEKLSEAKSNAGQAANKAKDRAAAAASATKGKLSEAGQSVTGAVGGVASMASNPVKLAQFVGIFFVGMLLITLSFTFLPVMVVAPQKFALLFAVGSIVVMGSLAFLKGPKALISQLMQREKLPFSATYIVSLVGTLVATIVLRSFLLTALFGLTQAISLMYFLASYVPGGKAVLNFCGRCTSRVTQKLCVRSCPGSK